MYTIFIAVDPGETTGVAWWQPISESWGAYQTKNPDEAMRWLEDAAKMAIGGNYEISVEKFTGGGYKTSSGNYTTELVGWFSNHFSYVHSKIVRRPISQQRLSGMERAQQLMAGHDIPGPHSMDALAHAIVHARSVA